MKHFIFAFLACLAFASCSAFDDDYFTEHRNQAPEHEINKFQVTQKSAEYFARKVSFDDSIARRVASVEPLAQGRDTLLYVVNFADNRGWLVLSGDKRTEAVLASAQTGRFDKSNLGGAAMWMNDLASKIYGIKQVNPQDTTSGSYASWLNIDTLALGIKKPLATRGRHNNYPPNYPGDEPVYHFDPSDPRYSEDILVDTKIKVTSEKEVGHLIETRWGQSSPWNSYTPIWTETSKHCPTGCVAVAGAQMLYFFHFNKGVPDVACTEIEGGGVVWPKGYNMNYRYLKPTRQAWEKMQKSKNYGYPNDTTATKLVSILMTQVGMVLGTKYTETSSYADDANLLRMYSYFGIQCDYADYNPSLIRQSLDRGIPVNISAFADRKRFELWFIKTPWEYEKGHAWIIDGYKDKTIVYTYTYNRRPRQIVPPEYQEGGSEYDPDRMLPPQSDPNSEFHYQEHPKFGLFTVERTERVYYWKMNLGWNGSGDDGQYSTQESGIWVTPHRTYQYNQKMVYNFRF